MIANKRQITKGLRAGDVVRVSVWGGDDCTTMQMYLMLLGVHLKVARVVSFM
jgi:hypothetical protein